MVRLLICSATIVAAVMAVAGCSASRLRSHDQLGGIPLPGAVLPPPQAAPGPWETQPSADPKASSLPSLLPLARLSERRGQTDQADRLYHVLIEKDPQNPVPYHRLGVMRAKEGRFEESNRFFTTAMQLAPTDPQLYSDFGYSYYLQHRLPEAEEVLRRAMAMYPNDPAVCNNLGLLLGEQGRDAESLALFRQVGTEAQAYSNLAFVYAQRAQPQQAKAHYSRALTLDDDLRPAAQALVQLAERERLQRQLASAARGPQAPQPHPGRPVRLPSVETQFASSPPRIDAQPAVFFQQQQPYAPAAAGASARPAYYEQAYPPTGARPEMRAIHNRLVR